MSTLIVSDAFSSEWVCYPKEVSATPQLVKVKYTTERDWKISSSRNPLPLYQFVANLRAVFTDRRNCLVGTCKKYSAGLPVLGVCDITNTELPDPFFLDKLGVYPAAQVLKSGRRTGLAVGLVLTYGACHAAAWNTHFPSTIECWLWRVSAMVVTVIPTYFIIFFFLTMYVKPDYSIF